MKGQRGAGMAEALVATTLGLFISGTMVSIYVVAAQSFRVREAHVRLADAGAMALGLMRADLRMAGMQGCNGDPTLISSVLNASTDPRYSYADTLGGYKAAADTWTPPLPTHLASGVPAPSPGSDILIVRRPAGVAAPLRSPLPGSPTDPLVADTTSPIPAGSLAMVSDCQSAVVFQVTATEEAEGGGAAQRVRLTHDASQGSPGNAQASLGKVFGASAEVRQVTTLHYFVAPAARRSDLRSLWRSNEAGLADEVIEGVESLWLRFSLDTDGDRMVDLVTDAAGVSNWSQVIEVQIGLVVVSHDDNLASVPQAYRADDRTITPADRRLRRTYTSAATIRNRAP